MTERPVAVPASEPPLPHTRSLRPLVPVVELRAVSVGYDSQRTAGPLSWRRGHARHRRYGPQPPVLVGIDLTVLPGEMVTVTGPARSGKSTLLHVVGLLLRPTTGSYLLNGIDTAALGDRDRSILRGQEIGIVFQPPRLLPDRSALDNVALPLLYAAASGGVRRRMAFECLERVGLAAEARRSPADLSAGERQRVALARALVTMPNLLVCDDPTAGLDEQQSAQVIGLLTALRSAGRTILVATRDQLAAAYSSRCLSIGRSAVVESGAYL